MSTHGVDQNSSQDFIDLAIRTLGPEATRHTLKVLDFGCGTGGMVRGLRVRGHDSAGCDIDDYWAQSNFSAEDQLNLSVIEQQPYRLPYDDDTFDIVISTSVLEHAQNTERAFQEIRRVLVPGGCAIHYFPAKWYLPREPHIFVPLSNFFWPRCPRWWFAFWAMTGIRNPYQRGMSWREVADDNVRYFNTGINYLPTSAYRQLSSNVFGNYDFPTSFVVKHGSGGSARLLRKLPSQRLASWLTREFRNTLLLQRKA